MKTLSALAVRAKRVAVLGLVLVGIGAGAATAYWTASDEVHGSVSSAAVGMSQTASFDPTTVYSAGRLTAADTVTVTNDGTAPARVTSAARVEGGSLPISIELSVADRHECTPTGSVGASRSLELADPLPPGESVTLCVRTALAPRAVFSHVGQSSRIAVTSTLTYAAGNSWTVSRSVNAGQEVDSNPESGLPPVTCRERDLLNSATWYSLRFSYSGKSSPLSGGLRAYGMYGETVKELKSSDVTFTVDGGVVTAQVTDDALRSLVGDLRNGNTANARVVVEQRTSDGAWVPAAVGKLHVQGKLITDEAYCGWAK